MNAAKRKRLERAGWKFGDVSEFLGLSDVDSALIEIRIALAGALRARRTKHRMSQTTLAKSVGSSQSRVAKMEAGDPSVSLDLLIRSLVAHGATPGDLGRIIASAGKKPAKARRSA